jgi:microcystin-dependent protein
MTSFTRAWTDAYQAIPPNSESAKQGARRIRELKADIHERLAVDHEWTGDEHDGKHAVLHMRPQTTDPATMSGHGQLYVKLQGTNVELYYKDSAGNIFPITSAGGGVANIILPGTILAFGNTALADGISYIQCDGRAVNRVTFSGLFFAIGTLWGVGDGINTFNVPDLRGRTLIGNGTGTGLSARVTGQTMGTETHRLTVQEIPGHQHAIYTQANGAVGAANAVLKAAAQDSFSLSESAGGDPGTGIANAHQNMQPSAVANWWIKT